MPHRIPFLSAALSDEKTRLYALGLASFGLLLVAYLFEYWGGLAPCVLCLWQRVPHALVILCVVSSLFMPFAGRLSFFILTLFYLASLLLAGVHLGVEWGLWGSPVSCGATESISWDREGFLKDLEKAPPPDCRAVPWSLFGISLAGYHVLASAVLLAIASEGWMRKGKDPS